MDWRKSPLRWIAVLAAALTVIQPAWLLIEFARGRGPLPLVLLVFNYALVVVITLWITLDARERRRTPCFDYGFFLLILWPFSLFWYCGCTRGWRGIGLACVLYVLAWLPAFTTAVIIMIAAIAAAVLNP